MQKFFCDKCGGECPSNSSSARPFPKVAKSTNGVDIGFQATPMYKGDMAGAAHICDNCFPELLIMAAKTFTSASVVAKQALMQSDAKNYASMRKILEKQLDTATQREKAAEARLVEAAQCISDAEEQRLSDAERIKVLEAQINQLNLKLVTVVKIKNGAEKQLAEDQKGNPEYIQAVHKRERIRIGG